MENNSIEGMAGNVPFFIFFVFIFLESFSYLISILKKSTTVTLTEVRLALIFFLK